jgi:N-acyl-D-amino-acid deacylase
VLDAIAEALRIGEQAGVPVQISHVKCTGKPNHGRAEQVLAAVQAARRNGQRVGVDQYAYDASSTGLDVLFPADELAVDREAFGRRLRDDAAYRATIHAALLRKMDQVGFGDFRFARIATAKGNEDLNGLLLPEAAEAARPRRPRRAGGTGDGPVRRGGAGPRRDDLPHAGGGRRRTLPARGLDRGRQRRAAARRRRRRQAAPARGLGNNPRVLGRYVRERGVLPLEVAIHKMTQVPARAFGLADRGELRVGAFADLVVFDPATIADRATYDEPMRPPEGIRAVFVNGQLAVDRGQFTGVRAGAVLRHQSPR